MLARRFTIAISVIIALNSNLAMADAESFERAVSIYLKGFQECVDGHTLRGKNIEQAKKKYQLYLNYKDEATAIDPTILTSSERDMQKNLRYCEKVYDNILRAEALPILEKGIAACEIAKTQLKEGKTEEAKQNIDIYNQFKTEALVSTESVLEIYSVASKVRLCGRVEAKIAKKEEEVEKLKNAGQMVLASLNEAQKQCDIAKNIVNNPSFDIKDLTIAKRTLKQVANKRKEATSNQIGLSTLEMFPEDEASVQINSLLSSTKACSGELNPKIAKIEKKQSRLIQTIAAASSQAEQGTKNCKTGEELLTASTFQFGDLNKVQWYQAETDKISKKIAANKRALNAAKTYKGWKTSKKFNSQYSALNKCIAKVSKLMASKQQELAKLKSEEQEAIARAAQEKQAAEEKEKQRLAALAEEKARAEAEAARLAEEAEAAAAEVEEEQEATLTERQEREKNSRVSRSWLDLIPDQQNAIDEEEEEEADDERLDDYDDEPNRTGRSWTDLIQQR